MIHQETLDFLASLAANNHKEWFDANRKAYEAAKKDVGNTVGEMIKGIAQFDPSVGSTEVKHALFRIFKDVRFSKDKAPYKTHFGAHITSAVKRSDIHSRAGYYIHIGPGESMLAGGAYLPQGDWLKAIRQEIHYNATPLKEILNQKDFKKYFGEIEGEKLKKAPKGYEPDHPEIELLKQKSFLASHKCTDETICAPDFQDHCARVFKALHPFDQFLNSSLD